MVGSGKEAILFSMLVSINVLCHMLNGNLQALQMGPEFLSYAMRNGLIKFKHCCNCRFVSHFPLGKNFHQFSAHFECNMVWNLLQ